MDNIFGREEEIEKLKRIKYSNNPELVVVYGRRRIGKTWLISEFFKQMDCVFLKNYPRIYPFGCYLMKEC